MPGEAAASVGNASMRTVGRLGAAAVTAAALDFALVNLLQTVERYGLLLVFLNVFLEQIGLPVPAFPTLVVAGALAAQGTLSLPAVLGLALVACLVADYVWYELGRRQGYRVLRTLCRLSLSPDSCVRQTESFFERLGLRSLLFAKFVPGFSTVAPPLAGATQAHPVAFLAWDGAGALAWAGSALLLGLAFHRAVDRVLDSLASFGSNAFTILVAGLVLFVAWKWWQRHRFFRVLRMARITPEDLHGLIARGEAPLVVDVRSPAARQADPRKIPGALALDLSQIEQELAGLTERREVILYCT